MIEVKAGYKQTELGVIPEDWDVFNLDKLSDRIGDGIHSTPKYSTDGDYFFINGNNLNNGIIEITADTKRVSKDEYLIHKREINNTTVLLSINGTIGNIAFYNNENIILGKSAAYINLNNGLDKRYLYQIFQTEFIKKYFDNELTGSTIKNLGLGSIRNSPIPLPPTKSEQSAIATILSDTDALIERLEKLIAKKKAIKQGTMQQLITGKKRLPGFSGEWDMRKLGEITTVIGGGTPSTYTPDYWNGVINWFTPTEIGLNKYTYSSLRKITEEGLKKCSARILPKGTVLLTTRAGIGDASILMNEGCTNQGFQSLVANDDISSEFLYYLVSTLKNVLIKNASGSTFLEISPNKIKQIDAKIPNLKEQTAIATILSDMDAEIEALEQTLDKYTMIKQGMMQQLLTGRIRVHDTD